MKSRAKCGITKPSQPIVPLKQTDEAVNNGGKWRIQGEEAWRESGTYVAVPGGKEYTVEFLEAAGYTTPAVQKKTPAAGAVEKVTGTYVVKS